MTRTETHEDRMLAIDAVAHDLAAKWGLGSDAVEWDGALGEETVVAITAHDGWLRIEAETAVVDGAEVPAGRVTGRFARRSGARCAEARAALRAAGIYAF